MLWRYGEMTDHWIVVGVVAVSQLSKCLRKSGDCSALNCELFKEFCRAYVIQTSPNFVSLKKMGAPVPSF